MVTAEKKEASGGSVEMHTLPWRGNTVAVGGARPRVVAAETPMELGQGRRAVCFGCWALRHFCHDYPQRSETRTVACGGTQVKAQRVPTLLVKVDGQKGVALIDSGCSQTLVKTKEKAPPPQGELMWI